jgi:hypothetical protein
MASVYLVLSHVLAFSVLFVDSLFDFFNNNDIPDEFAVAGIVGGLLLHSAETYTTGSMEPVLWSLGLGTAFFLYGWLAYWQGMWGGADALAMGTLGFAAPGTVSGSFSLIYVMNLLFNFMVAAAVVTVVYGGYMFFRAEGGPEALKKDLLENERKLSAMVLGAGIFSALLVSRGMNGFVFFGLMLILLFLYRFLKVVQEDFMVREIQVEDLEGGEVPAPDQGFGKKIQGLTEEDIAGIEKKSIKVRSGVPFIPVFLLTLLLTDLTSAGMWMLFAIY